jgi:DNA adenine methylase
MSDKLRRKRPTTRSASKRRSDQGSDPKSLKYKIRQKFPDPVDDNKNGLSSEQSNELHDEQLALAPVETVAPTEAQPFLKWVGGKAQLLEQFDAFFPAQINRYVEPFLGGGAVFFHLHARFPQMQAFLRDNNDELINTYTAVRDRPRELMRRLDSHLAAYLADREKYYYLVRLKHHLPTAETLERAARMVFLNKTCFNGLWRVNSKGEFNVPIGSHRNPALYDEENIHAASRALEGVHLQTQDFRDTLAQTRRGDFVYIDPPYYPVSPTASFTSYTKDDFGAEQQRELAALFADATRRGVRLMISNSDTEFIRHLYRNFTIHTVSARRMVNCDGTKRGKINEVVVLGGI